MRRQKVESLNDLTRENVAQKKNNAGLIRHVSNTKSSLRKGLVCESVVA